MSDKKPVHAYLNSISDLLVGLAVEHERINIQYHETPDESMRYSVTLYGKVGQYVCHMGWAASPADAYEQALAERKARFGSEDEAAIRRRHERAAEEEIKAFRLHQQALAG